MVGLEFGGCVNNTGDTPASIHAHGPKLYELPSHDFYFDF